jgi:hypothetical protein
MAIPAVRRIIVVCGAVRALLRNTRYVNKIRITVKIVAENRLTPRVHSAAVTNKKAA